MPELRRRLGGVPKAQLMALAEQAGIPFAPVNRPQDLFEDPHLNQSGGLVTTKIPEGATVKLPKIPLRLDGSGFDLRSHPPGIGEGSRDFYRRCGYTTDEIEGLIANGIIEIR